MKPASAVRYYPGTRAGWETALAEALGMNRVCTEKFGPRPDNPTTWVYRVRKRCVGRHDMWLVYLPTGRVPDRGGKWLR